MRDTEHFKRHMSIVVQVGDEPEDVTPIEDPFHTTKLNMEITVTFSLWERVKVLFTGQHVESVHARVKVRADGVAIGRWFQGADICERCCRARIDGPGQHSDKPGYEHGEERWCEACYYGDVIPSRICTPE